jgi:hypothetical protein
MLIDALQAKIPSILCLSSNQCRSCLLVEPAFQTLVNEFGSEINFLKADISYVPTYWSTTLQRWKGSNITPLSSSASPSSSSADLSSSSSSSSTTVTTSAMTSDVCNVCQGIGLVPCHHCDSKGYQMIGAIAVICRFCGGKYKLRCQSCSGTCVVCG